MRCLPAVPPCSVKGGSRQTRCHTFLRPVHALLIAVGLQQLPELCVNVLATSITMDNQAAGWQLSENQSLQRSDDQSCGHCFSDLPADDLARTQVQPGCQVCPLAALQWQIGDVADQHLSRAFDLQTVQQIWTHSPTVPGIGRARYEAFWLNRLQAFCLQDAAYAMAANRYFVDLGQVGR